LKESLVRGTNDRVPQFAIPTLAPHFVCRLNG